MSSIWLTVYITGGVLLLGMLVGSGLDTASKRRITRENAAYVREIRELLKLQRKRR